jgi:hypothetical protein
VSGGRWCDVTLLQDDREFLAAFREGRRDALERVYRQYVRVVDGYVRALARTTGDPEMAQRSAVADLVQHMSGARLMMVRLLDVTR